MGIFLSYAHQDAEQAQVLRDELDELAGPVWLDRGLTGGQVWWDEILAQLRHCSLFVIAVSPASLRSEACLAEIDYATALRRPFLAVRVATTDLVAAPDEIRRTQVIDFMRRDVEAVRALAKAVLRVDQDAPLPDVLPIPPPIPQSYRDRYSAVFNESLSMGDQLSLVARLRFDMDNGNNAREAAELLRQLHDRPDLSWKVRQDISTILGNPQEIRIAYHQTSCLQKRLLRRG